MTSTELTPQLYSQAATLMLIGMTFVFAFLAMLIVAIKLFITPLAEKYPDETHNKKTPNAQNHHAKDNNHESSAIVAVISAAITHHRNKNE